MSVLFKPLFSPNLLARRLTGYAPTLSLELTALADQWARTAADPAFLNLNEKPLQGQFLSDIFARLIAIEIDIDDRVNRLFNLTDADRLLLADHSRHAMIDYPYGAV